MSSWDFYPPYVPVAERRRKAEAHAKKLAGKGQVLAPIKLEGRTIVSTYWGKAWCDNLEAYSDFANRLPRGRTYVRNGSVIDLQISAGKITAMVYGSELYKINIKIEPLAAARWKAFKAGAADKVTNLLDLLQGRLSKEILSEISAKGSGLFPAPKEISMTCSCPDGAYMCKHIAAALYGVGARLDSQPELFFTLRGVDMQELIAAASESATAPLTAKGKLKKGKAVLAEADLSALFGVEIEPSTAKVAPKRKRVTPAKKVPGKPKKATRS